MTLDVPYPSLVEALEVSSLMCKEKNSVNHALQRVSMIQSQGRHSFMSEFRALFAHSQEFRWTLHDSRALR